MINNRKPINNSDEESSSFISAQSVQGVVINEILADPNDSSPSGGFDTDGDGSVETSNDEFIELFNTTGTTVDISGWTITDAGGGTFTFPVGATIPPNGFVTVVREWTGTLPTNTYEGLPALNNGSEVITLSDGTSDAIAAWGSGAANSGGDDFGTSDDAVTMAREPDGGMTINDEAPPTPNTANICFHSGTGIQTPTGYTKIEALKVGDMVNTASGSQMPVKWVGVQSVDINSNRNLLKSNPVLIQANALGEGIPSNDLRISPNHAIHVDGLLINGGALVNGVNIYQEVPTEDFKYYHVELDSHELVIAENTWAESYLPQNENRDDFDNASEFDQQYPDGRKLILWPLDYPRISSQVKVPDYIKDKILRKEKISEIA